VQVDVTDTPLLEARADLHVVALFTGEELPEAYRGLAGSGDARAAFKKLALLRRTPEGRLLVVGLGDRDELDAERLRVAAALAVAEAGRYEARAIAWGLPEATDGPSGQARAGALVEGTMLASYRFDRYKARDPDDPPPPVIERLTLCSREGAGIEETARLARISAEAANRARELQDLPANVVTPRYLAARAAEIADAHGSVSCEVLGRAQISDRGMGGLAAVAKGSAEEPQLISLRYDGTDAGETLGLVGKAVTFDTGGISIKPATKMEEMKMDMSGGAAVLEALAAAGLQARAAGEELLVQGPSDRIRDVAAERGWPLRRLVPRAPSLEETFLRLQAGQAGAAPEPVPQAAWGPRR
jgi:leucyl aminopeptidase